MSTGFEHQKIREADGVEIISLVDNSIDMLSTIDQKEAFSFRQWTKNAVSNCPKPNMDFQC